MAFTTVPLFDWDESCGVEDARAEAPVIVESPFDWLCGCCNLPRGGPRRIKHASAAALRHRDA